MKKYRDKETEMIKKLYHTLNVIVWSFAGALIAQSIYRYYHYKTHMEWYETQSAPWYLGIQVNAVCFIVVAAIIFLIRWILRRKYGKLI